MRPHRRGGFAVDFGMRRPGAHNKTRVMHDAIYILKIAMLHGQYRLPPLLKRQVLALAEFVCLLYVPYFLQTPLAAAAPHLDRDLWVNLQKYQVFLSPPVLMHGGLLCVTYHPSVTGPKLTRQ